MNVKIVDISLAPVRKNSLLFEGGASVPGCSSQLARVNRCRPEYRVYLNTGFYPHE